MATIYKYPGGNNYEYTDEEDAYTVDQMKQHLVQYFPELARAAAEESKDDAGNKIVTFVKKAGTKGGGRPG